MADYFEIDYLSVGDSQSGDAIAMRYECFGNTFVHVVDGGFQDDGPHDSEEGEKKLHHIHKAL